MQENQNGEQAAPESEIKEHPVSAGPRHAGKAAVKKAKSYAEIEAKKQLEAVKVWSDRVLEAQVASKNCSAEMKAACEEELKKRAEARKAKAKK